MASTTLLQLLAVLTCCLLVTCGPVSPRAAPSPRPEVSPAEGPDQDHQRPPRSFEGQLTPGGAALLNSLHHTFPKRREVGGPPTTTALPGAWLVNPDTPEAAGSSIDYRTERYHISDLFAEGTG